MPSITPTRSNDYEIGPDTRIGVPVWNGTFADVAARLAALEILKADVEATIEAIASGSLNQALQATLGPQLSGVQTAFASLQVAIALAQDQLIAIQTGIVLGSSVQITAGGMFADATSLQEAIEALSAAVDDDPQFAGRVGQTETDINALQADVETRLPKAGGRLTGALSSKVMDHGTKGSAVEPFLFSDGNTHKITIAGNVVIDPQGLAEGDVMQVNALFQSGSITVNGTTSWELGGGTKSTSIADLSITLAAGKPYRLIFEVVAGVRTGVFQ